MLPAPPAAGFSGFASWAKVWRDRGKSSAKQAAAFASVGETIGYFSAVWTGQLPKFSFRQPRSSPAKKGVQKAALRRDGVESALGVRPVQNDRGAP